MLDIYGFENLKELRDKSVEERYTPESYQIFLKRREKRLRNEYVPSKYEVSIIRKDGSIRQLEVFRKKVLWGGEPQFEVIYNDVTEQKQAEEAIHASELRYRRLFESAPQDGILIVNAKTRLIIDVNPFLTELVGFPREKLIGKELWEIGVLKDMIASKANFEELLRERYIRYDDLPLKTADGRQIAVEFISNVYEVGIDKLIQCNIRDITERKKAELALKESEKKYRELVETAQEGILVSDADSKITFVNQRICEMQGYTETELVGKYAYAFLDEKGRETFIHDIEGRRLGIKGEYDTQILHKDGSLIHVRVGSTPLYDNEGKYAGVMSVIVDISGLKNAEKHILHLNSVLNALRGINQLITLEKDRGILLQKSCDLLVNARGYDNAWVALTDGNGKFVSGVSSGISSKIFTPILQDFSKGKYPPCSGDLLQQKENIILCPQFGSQHADCPFEELGDNLGNLSGRLEYEGKLYGVLSVQLPSKLAGNKEEQGLFNELTNDIAFGLDRLEKTNQLEDAKEQARETEKLRAIDLLRSELLANVSHELRTPLSAIKGFTTTMLRKDVKWSAKQREDFLQTIDQETDRLTRLISDILDMSRLDAGAMKLKQGKYLVSEIVSSVKGRLEVLTAHHQLVIDVPEKLPAIFVDEMRIGQVISNLVENAVKFSLANSAITIGARLEKENIVISVTDHGEGMPKEVTEKLFNRFYQAEDVVTGRRSGTGLGLAICRGIIENHGGKIWVESKVKEGSKFSFSLPIIEEKTND
jgi:PAS domain S-box-containing protein